MANSFSALSVALTVGSIFLAFLGLISAIGWGYIVKLRAENEARKTAESIAVQRIEQWLAEEAPGLIRRKLEMLQDTSIGRTDDDVAADEMGQAAG
jgi:hypothetical protein